MDQHETTTPTERKPLGRRTVLKGAAWSVPAVVAVGATPAFAATGDTVEITAVAVSPLATDALIPARYINDATKGTAAVTVSGTATPDVDVYVTVGDYTSDSATATSGIWSITIPSSEVSTWVDGTYIFTAIVSSGNKPSFVASDLPVIRDTLAPSVTMNAASITPGTGNKGGTASGTMGVSQTASQDLATLQFRSNVAGFATSKFQGPDIDGAWSVSWQTTANANGGTIYVTQSDQAGNVSPVCQGELRPGVKSKSA